MKNESFNSKTHLSYEDLVEYTQGNLSNSEMHRIELHLISCQLCNEALEGVGTLNKYDDATPSILKIKKSTDSEEGGLGLTLYHYIGIAASIILIAVLGFVFTRTADETALLADESSSAPSTDRALKQEAEPKAIEFEDEESEDSLTLAVIEVDETVPVNNQTDYQLLAKEETTPPPPVQETDPAMDSSIISSSAGLADLAANDSSAIDISDDTTLIAAEIAEDEAFDMARAQKKLSSAPSEPIQGAEGEAAVSNDNLSYIQAQPEKGSRAYQRYLRRNLNYPVEASDNNIEGEVELNVVINADGSIGEITIVKSLGYGCDEEAIRLVREGQSWLPGTRGSQPIIDTVSVTVSFKP